jgi:hypothetical protein
MLYFYRVIIYLFIYLFIYICVVLEKDGEDQLGRSCGQMSIT